MTDYSKRSSHRVPDLVFETALEAARYIRANRGAMMARYAVLVMAGFALAYGRNLIEQSLLETMAPSWLKVAMMWALSAPVLLVYAALIVPVHRTILLGEEAGPAYRLRIGRGEIRYVLLWFLALAPVTALYPAINSIDSLYTYNEISSLPPWTLHSYSLEWLLVSFMALAGQVILWIGCYYLFMRLLLSLPGAAIDRPQAVRHGWRLAAGKVGAIFVVAGGIVVMVGLPLLILAEPIRTVGAWLGYPSPIVGGLYVTPPIIEHTYEALAIVCKVAGVLALAVFLSFCYRDLDHLAGEGETVVARSPGLVRSGRLRIWATVSASWGDLLANWRRTLLLGLPLGAVCAATVTTWVTLAGGRHETFVEEAFENPDFPSLSTIFLPTATASELLLGLLGVLPIIFAVAAGLPALHRTAREGATAPMLFRFGRPESLYGLTLLAMFLIFGSLEMILLPAAGDSIFAAGLKLFPEIVESPGLGLTLFVGLLAILLTGLVAALLAWLPARILLVLPALATGVDRPFVQGWRLGRGNGWRLLWIIFVAILPAVWLLSPINLLLSGWVTDPAQIDRDAPTALMAPGDLWVTSAIVLTGMLYAVVFLLAGTVITTAWRSLTETEPEAGIGAPL